jgi:shikimate kinase
MEHDLLHKIEERLTSGEKAVISLGGGLVANPELEEIMSRIGVVVYLQVPYDILFRRIEANGLPPFLDTPNPYETFLEICKEREPYYFKYEHLTVDLGNLSVPEANNLIENKIIEYFRKKI